MNSNAISLLTWPMRMALRDARRSWGLLLLLVSAISVGVCGLVAIRSFRSAVEGEIETQARQLLGADVVLSTPGSFSEAVEQFLVKIKRQTARELSFSSMIYAKNSGESRLAQVNAVDDSYPLYGALATIPAEAVKSLAQGNNIIIDRLLMLQMKLKIGDTLRVGEREYLVQAEVAKIPGMSEAQTFIAPQVFLPLRTLDGSELLGKGSRVFSRVYLRLAAGESAESFVATHQNELEALSLSSETANQRKKSLGRALDHVVRYLGLMAFLSLVVGALGVAGSVQLYLRRKVRSVALLRCLGAPARSTILVFFWQLLFFGLIGIALGTALGGLFQVILPQLVQYFVAVEFNPQFSLEACLLGMITGVVVLGLSSCLSLFRLRLVSPLTCLRLELEPELPKDNWSRFLWFLLWLSTFAAAYAATDSLKLSGYYVAALTVVVLVLGLLAQILISLARRIRGELNFVFAQGVANLHRPGNQTLTLIILLGAGIFLLDLFLITRQMIVEQVSASGSAGEPNMIAFDLQSDQRQEFLNLATERGLKVVDVSPMVPMRLVELRGESVSNILKDPQNTLPEWSLKRTYRSTYRDRLSATEKLASGVWIKENAGREIIPISVGERIVQRLRLNLGDILVFDVQGLRLKTQVTSVREIDWQRMRPNFFVVFPTGVLEDAPQSHIVALRAEDEATRIAFQRKSAETFGNVSLVDLVLVQGTIDAIFQRLEKAVSGVGFLGVLATGLVILAAAVASSEQRAKECSLLKILGASPAVVAGIVMVEYLVLAIVAALSGSVLAYCAGLALDYFVFSATLFTPKSLLLPPVVVLIPLVVLVGMLGSLRAYRLPRGFALE